MLRPSQLPALGSYPLLELVVVVLLLAVVVVVVVVAHDDNIVS